MQDLTKIPLHEILLANGYILDRNKSSMNYPCLTNENGEKIIVSKKGDSYLYFNTQDDTDRGNIISFARHRNILLNDLISNYDNSIKINITNQTKFFDSSRELNFSYYIKQYEKFQDCDVCNNPLLKRRGFSNDVLLHYQGVLKQDEYANIVIPHYKLQQETGIVSICGFTKRLNIPLTKDKEGNQRDKPLKNIHYGNKGIETLIINKKDPKTISDIVVSESILDSLSYLQMKNLNPNNTILLSFAGNFNLTEHEKTFNFFIDKVKNARITLAFDNDLSGKEFTQKLEKFILDTRKQLPNIYRPFSKDCNDDLKLLNTTKLSYLTRDTYDKWAQQQIHCYYFSKDSNARALILHNIRKADSIKPISQENRDRFNTMSKHKSVKNL